MIQLVSIYLTNAFGIVLLLVLLANCSQSLRRDTKESKILMTMILCTLVSCLADPICFTCDGKPGLLNFLGVYGCNFWMFCCTIIVGPLWILLVSNHLFGRISKLNHIFVVTLFGVGAVALIVNFFKPIVFSVDEMNVYRCKEMYAIFAAIEFILIGDGIVMYLKSRRSSGKLKFFPVWQFVIPIALGTIAQSVWYGISTIWAGMAISICGILIALQNEAVYRDSMTGLYSRYYLDNLKQQLSRRQNSSFTAMMLDLNSFKSINDNYGHEEGDRAIIASAEILKQTVGSVSSVVRYAGDEFVIILNTQSELTASRYAADIREAFSVYNKTSGKPYKLSAAIGFCQWNMKEQTIDELMNEIDTRMYDDKKSFYETNRQFDRRGKR